MKAMYFAFIFLLIAQPSMTQNNNYVFRHIDTRNGLAGQEPIGIAQDEKGFIWITTDNGLQRFDGENFMTYRHNNRDSNSISSDEEFIPVFDKNKNLWLKDPDSSVNIFDIRAQKTIHLNPAKNILDSGEDFFLAYCTDAWENMWLISNRALYKYDYNVSKTIKIKTFPGNIFSGSIGTMVCDTTTGNLFIGTITGMIEYDVQKKLFFDAFHNRCNSPLFTINNEPYFTFIDSKRNLWISTWAGQLFRYNIASNKIKQYNFKTTLPLNNRSMAGGICEDKKGNVWICANSSDLFYYDALHDSLRLSVHMFIEKPSSNQKNVLKMFCDRENNIWIGTAFGLYIFNPRKQKIFTVQSNPFTALPLPASQVETFGESIDKWIWVSSRDGGGVSVFDENMNIEERMFYTGDVRYKNVDGIIILAFCNDMHGKLWMASYNTLISYTPVTKKITVYQVPQLNFRVRCMCCDDNGYLWIGGGQKLMKLNTITLQKKIYENLGKDFTKESFEIRDMVIDKKNKFWVATYGAGVFCFDAQAARFIEQYRHAAKNNNSLINNNCTSIAWRSDTVLIVGTVNGLDLLNMDTKNFTLIANNDGTESNVIQGEKADDKRNIFVSTANGLYKFDGLTNSFAHYEYEDGIIDHQFYTKILQLQDGRMLVGGVNNFIYFNPADLNETFTPPDVQFTGIKIFDKQMPLNKLDSFANEIQLSYKQNFITIQYASLYFNSPSKINYYYKLDGVDKNWVNAGTVRYASYTNLNNGTYTFEVKCMNNEGVTSKNISKLIINISPPYYKTWWFVLLWVIVAAAIIYSIYAYRMRTKKALALVRQHIASDLHDDIGSTLNSISVYSEVAGKHLQIENESVKNILDKMGSSSRNMIDRMNDIVWAINPKNDDFENIIKRMQYFAAELLPGKNILLQFETGADMRNIKLLMDKRKNFYLIYKEAVNNAYKYSCCTDINVSISVQEGNIVMIVADNGKGFDTLLLDSSKEKEKTSGGNGLRNMQERAKEIDAHFEINSWVGKGTRVFLKMKI